MSAGAPSLLSRLRARYRTRRAFRWAVEGGLLLLLVLGVSLFQTRHHPRGTAPVGTFTDLSSGATVTLASWAGRPTLVAVWAPWCGVCKTESDNLSRAARWLGSRANVVSVATAYEDVAQVHAYVRAQGVDYPVLLTDEGFSQRMGVGAYPTLFVLDAQGRVVGSAEGYTTTLGLVVRALWAAIG